uniref:Uncharacterized protein n=1 Tax=Meloidogyne enterolobii TaxID=390850 RepID=A0A6V7XCK5_MELEN|nr:unnamed protein product [Meloidogyne enterolobii]
MLELHKLALRWMLKSRIKAILFASIHHGEYRNNYHSNPSCKCIL